MKELLCKRVDLEDERNDRMTALHWAGFPDHLDEDDTSEQERNDMEEIVKLLVNAGANVRKENLTGWTPLHFAVHGASLKSVKVLLEKNPDVNASDRHKQTPLFIAVKEGRVSVVEALIDAGTDIRWEDGEGDTVL